MSSRKLLLRNIGTVLVAVAYLSRGIIIFLVLLLALASNGVGGQEPRDTSFFGDLLPFLVVAAVLFAVGMILRKTNQQKMEENGNE